MDKGIKAICSQLSDSQYSFTEADRRERATDWGTEEKKENYPDLVIWPTSTEDVSNVLWMANEHEVPVTPYAAGTSLESNPVPVNGGISLDLSDMDEIYDIRPEDLQIDVGPGCYGDSINEAVRKYGLFLPALPSSGKISTIGGMIANDASGMKTVKYGEVADWLIEAEAVLPTGEVVTVGSKAVKTSSGYNLLDLLVGSEGTLAVITRLTLKLAGRPEQIWGGRASFETIDDAAAAISDAIQSGVDVAKIELIDSLSVEIANESLDTALPEVPQIFVEFHANHSIEQEIEFCKAVFEPHGLCDFEVAERDKKMKQLWEARRELADAVEPYDPELSPLTPGDVTVPIGSFPEIIQYIKAVSDEHDIMIPCFGHAGDGNIHYFVMVEPDDQEMVERGEKLSRQIVEKAIELGGTATGEHGVGTGKRKYLDSEYNQETVQAMQSVKSSLDPNNILNPGKVLPDNNRPS